MKTMVKHSLFSLAIGAAVAFSPLSSASLNVESLTRDNFYEKVVPLAQQEGQLNFFDFSSSLGPVFTEVAIPEFEKKYGITVNYYQVDGRTAAQQIIATKNANRHSSVDLFFSSSAGALTTLHTAGAIANIPFHELVPNMASIREDIATTVNGIDHGGSYAPFHLNQVSLAYNSRRIDDADVPRTFEQFLNYAKANPKKVAVTSPLRGGSGEGFAMSASMQMMSNECLEEAHDFNRSRKQAEIWAKSGCLDDVVDYFEQLSPYVEFTNGNADTLNLLANNQVFMGTAWEDMTYTYLSRSLLPRTVRQSVIESGLVGGADGLLIPENAKNKAAAILFLNELMSAHTQAEKIERIGSRSPRTDINFSESVPEKSLNFLIDQQQLSDAQQNWYNKHYTRALSEHLTVKVLAN